MALSIKPYIENKERIHLIGIGGVSMNSLGELLLSRGVPISGSDRLRTDVTARLEALGAKITYEHKPENVEGASLIVRTDAVHDDNPEIVRAHELGIPVMERAEGWGHLMRDYDNVVCLAGTHGKTTSTSMMTLMTMEAQMDPTVMVGSNLPAIGGTLRIGGKGCFVAEKNLQLVREGRLKELEDHLAAAAELADSCGLTSEEVVETLRALLEEHNL